MPDEPNKDQPEDIAGILSDLESVLGGAAAPAVPPPAPAPAPATPPKPVEAPKPAPAAPPKIELGTPPPPPAKPAEPPKPAEAPKPAEPPKPAAPAPSIELAPRAGMIAPAPKAAEPPKQPVPPPPPPPPAAATPPPPAAVPPPPAAKPPEPAKPAAAPAPASAPAGGEEIPKDVTKDHIRRVAYIHGPSHAEAKAALAAFLSQAGRTISKKPLYLREVLSMEALEPAIVLERVKKAKAVVVLAVVEGWPKAEQLSDAFESAGIQYHEIAPGDVQKKSMAVDIIVDMMLLPGEE